jgi:hypothetical protein
MARHSRPHERAAHLEAYAVSGLSQAAYAEAHHLRPKTLQRWLRAARAPKTTVLTKRAFLEVIAEDPRPAHTTVLVLPSGARLELGDLPAPAWLVAVDGALRC